MPDNNGVEYTSPPQSRNEAILADTLNGVEYTDPAQSRIEALLKMLNALIISGGGSPNVINLKSLGAAGDGTTDDSDAVKDAFDLAAETGMPLYIPEGIYLVKWGQIITTLTEKGIRIFGDGKFKSIIKMETSHTTSAAGNYGNGVILMNRDDSSIAPDISMSDIGITWDGDENVAVTHQSRLLGMYGYFGEVFIEDCYLHLGGVDGHMPPDTCFFPQLGADIISIKNCLIENFTNNKLGGGIWIVTDDKISEEETAHHKIRQAIVRDNVFKTSNEDEALALYPSRTNATPTECFKDVLIDGNVITHKNWLDPTADCYPTNGLLTVFIEEASAPVVDANIVISNNTIDDYYAHQEPIRTSGFTGVDICNNNIRVRKTSLVPDTQTPANSPTLKILYFDRVAKGVVRDNVFDFTDITDIECRAVVQATAEALWKNNVIKTGYNFRIAPSNTSNTGGVLTFEGNTVYPLNNSKFIIYKSGVNTKLFVYKNTVYGNTNLNNLWGENFIIKGNHFNAGTGTDNTYDLPNTSASGAIDYQMNDGLTIRLNDSSIQTKISKFKYMGKKKNLVFRVGGAVVEDSAEVRALFFASTANTEIVYLGTE